MPTWVGELAEVPWLIDHARRTARIIRQSIVPSLITKAAFVTLALLGHAWLWAAIAGDTGVSSAVALNALRMLRGSEGRS